MNKTIFLFFSFFYFFSLFSQVNPNNIDIVRDKFGVPHIFGITDKETAYGLAWAHSEDNFITIQKTFLPAVSLLGSYSGKQGIVMDYVAQLLRCREVAQNQHHNLSTEVLEVIRGYVEGINAYAKANPEEVLVKKCFPISLMDYLTGYNMVLHFFSDTGDILSALLNDRIKPLNELTGVDAIDKSIGSNAFAISKKKTKDKKTYLNVNTHQPLEGPFSWYEVHMVSEQGWNMLGSLFPGSPFPLIGTNENLGWSHTYNYPDLIDIYQLEMHPQKKNKYKYDGEWLKLEKTKAKLKLKIFWGIKIPIRKKVFWCVYGPVIKNKSGYFSFHSNAFENISSADQWYKMNKAKKWGEFKKALQMTAIPRFNVVYADRKDNIFYLSAGRIPIRKGDYNWKGVLPGNTSKTKTTEYHSMSDLPQILNPKHGYIFNTNNSPFNAAHPEDNLKEKDYDSTLRFREKENNRSIRFMELIKEYPTISYKDFQRIKYDQQYPDSIVGPFQLNEVFNINANAYPDIKELIEIIQNWNKKASVDNMGAAQWRVYYEKLTKRAIKEGMYRAKTINEKIIVETLRETKKYLLDHFKTIRLRLGEYQKHVRGGVEMQIPGLSDMIAATTTGPYKNGMVKAVSGESYIMLVRYSEDKVEIETILPYGESTHASSRHYTDQMDAYARQKRKSMTLDKEKIYSTAVKIYHPIGKKKHQ